MKKIVLILTTALLLTNCESSSDTDGTVQTSITFNFTHSWDDTAVSVDDFNTIKFINANTDELSIERLRYLISKVTFTTSNNETLRLGGYNLVDLTNSESLAFTPTGVLSEGTYNISFTFGFDNDDNANNYQDLNSASWNVPAQLGGGYHYMQLEGKFIDNTASETGYAYHAIRAVDNSGSSPVFQDTFFEVDLGKVTITNNATINVDMNIAEWFKTPNTWDLNVLNNMLMPNFDAQVLMFENGQNVFSLKPVDQ